MDPDANLRETRALLSRIRETAPPDPEDINKLCELVETMDDWLCRGGLIPAPWIAGRLKRFERSGKF